METIGLRYTLSLFVWPIKYIKTIDWEVYWHFFLWAIKYLKTRTVIQDCEKNSFTRLLQEMFLQDDKNRFTKLSLLVPYKIMTRTLYKITKNSFTRIRQETFYKIMTRTLHKIKKEQFYKITTWNLLQDYDKNTL